MNKRLSSAAAAAGSLLLTLTASPIGVSAQPWSPQPPVSDSKSDCAKKSGGQGGKSKDCDTISDERMSTRDKAEAQTSTSKTGDSVKSSNMGGFNKAKTASGSKTTKSEDKKQEKPAAGDADKTKPKEGDKISDERMSTRGLNPPKDAAKDQAPPKADTTANPK